MSKSKSTEHKEVGIQFSKYTGGFYVDTRELIENELERIRAARRRRSHQSDNASGNTDNDRNNRKGNLHN